MKKNLQSKRQLQVSERKQQDSFFYHKKELTVYNKWQKIMLQECYDDFFDGGNLKIKSYTNSSITYEASFNYKQNLNSFLFLFFANIRSGAPSWIDNQ